MLGGKPASLERPRRKQLTFLLGWRSGNRASLQPSHPSPPKIHKTPSASLLLPVCLFIHIPDSSICSMANSCQPVAGFTSWSKVDFINRVVGFHSGFKYPATVPSSGSHRQQHIFRQNTHTQKTKDKYTFKNMCFLFERTLKCGWND